MTLNSAQWVAQLLTKHSVESGETEKALWTLIDRVSAEYGCVNFGGVLICFTYGDNCSYCGEAPQPVQEKNDDE